ncbi:hypothetical protein DEU56DRAFT_764962 [Suillus clintonianus]|uniref:uncharacterized protein n=1 Tax=Suillus clintonianus TaxID=1904413 RepID=UPI001B883F50|nr:uncharacterized protein DEU56DRAFT_764962 [Suillus clintonianus]KAG2157502.1 hypothetical protein DEU56DRAFT_764962 [Suillus clintonianus]
MPSAALQSRIQAFEALIDQRPSQTTSKPSFVVLKARYPPSTNPIESPISPTSDSFQPIAPFTPPKSLSRSPSPSPPNLGRRTSLIDLKDWIVDDGPNGAPSGVSHYNGRHLKGFPDLIKAPPQVTHNPAAARSVPISSAPLINLESPPKSRPPLPPRKPSYTSTDSSPSISNSAISDSSATLRPSGRSDSLTVEHTYPPPRPHAFGSARVSHAPASSISSFHSVSLSSDGSDLKPMSPRLSMQSSLGTNGDNDGVDGDIVSIADSYENVSSTISPTANVPFDWGKAISNGNGTPRPEPPKLPQRPGTKLLSPSVSRSVSTTSSTPTTRRPRPPPPPPPPPSLSRTKLPSSRTSPASTSASTSDRSSILSNATTTSLTSISTTSISTASISTQNSGQLTQKASLLLRPTPVPPAARTRYEALFVVTVVSRRKAEKTARKAKTKSSPLSTSSGKKSRQAAGWRGLSVDLITNPEDHPVLSSKEADSDNDDDADHVPVGPEERLGGRIVRLIWSASKLDRGKLRDIWNDCDPSSTGFLDREAFVKGMWRIDEELRRAQLNRRTSALSAASSQRIPHRPKNASNSRLLLQ